MKSAQLLARAIEHETRAAALREAAAKLAEVERILGHADHRKESKRDRILRCDAAYFAEHGRYASADTLAQLAGCSVVYATTIRNAARKQRREQLRVA